MVFEYRGAKVGDNSVVELIVARTPQEVLELRADWTLLRAEFGMPTPNADLDRFLATLEGLGQDMAPHVTLIRESDKPLALLVGRTVTRRGTSRIGYAKVRSPKLTTLELVYGGLISNGSKEASEAVLSHLQALLQERQCDHIMVNYLPIDHHLAEALRGGAVGTGRPVIRDILHWETRLLDEETGERVHHNSSRTRATWRRKDRKLRKHFDGDLELVVVKDPEQLESFLAAADSITRKTYHGAIGVGFRDTPTWRSILAAMAGTGNLRSYLLNGGDQALAYVGGSVYQDVFTLEATGFLPELRQLSPGTVLMNQLFDDLAEAKIPMCDFGFGDAEYKRLYGSNSWQEGTIDCFGPRLSSRVAHAMNRSAKLATVLGKRMVAQAGAFNRVRKIWRNRLEGPRK